MYGGNMTTFDVYHGEVINPTQLQENIVTLEEHIEDMRFVLFMSKT